jgi:hypothetical protein
MPRSKAGRSIQFVVYCERILRRKEIERIKEKEHREPESGPSGKAKKGSQIPNEGLNWFKTRKETGLEEKQ